MHTTRSSAKPLWYRLLVRAGEYTTTGAGTFLVDLALVWLLLTIFTIDESLAIGIGFILAMHLNYLAQRFWVFRESPESMGRTYSYFIIFAGAGAAVIPALVELTQQQTDLELFSARIIVGTFIGIIGFTFNTFFNFKCL